MELRPWSRRITVILVAVGFSIATMYYLHKAETFNSITWLNYGDSGVVKVHVRRPNIQERNSPAKGRKAVEAMLDDNPLPRRQQTSTLVPPTNLTITPEMPLAQLEDQVYKYMMTPKYACRKSRRMGHAWDGGWDVCLDERFGPSRNNCLVYSFGIANDWSFDDAVEKEFACEGHAFDPSIHKPDHKHSDKVFFHNLGVSGADTDNHPHTGWKMRTVLSMRANMQHTKRIIDIMKMDVESAEWPAIDHMLKNNQFLTIKQFCFEIHYSQPNRKIFTEIYHLLHQLELAGLRLFKAHANPACKYISNISNRTFSFCNELYYVNMKFRL